VQQLKMELECEEQTDSLSMFPELLLQCFASLTEEQLKPLSCVCKLFLSVIDSDGMWRRRCQLTKGLTFKPKTWTWKETYHRDTKDTCVHLGKVDRSDAIAVWEKLNALYQKGEKLLCSAAGCSNSRNTLWACLECAHAGCGRRYNAHALNHFKETGHVLAVKLLTLEFSCYVCEQWLGSVERPAIEKERVEEMSGWFLSSCPESIRHIYMVPDTKERRERERAIRWAGDEDRSWSAFPTKWYEKWLDFIVGDTCAPKEPIDNSSFVSDDGKTLRSQVSYDDLTILSNEQWDTLVQVYGGGPQILWENDIRQWVVVPVNHL